MVGNDAQALLYGPRVRLAPLTPAHLAHVRRWRADPDITRYWVSDAPPTEVEVERWFAENRAAGTLTWVILDEAERPIGYLNLFAIDGAHRRAELAVMIGERASWGQGYAKEALRAVLGHAFGPAARGGLGLHKVSLSVFADNVAARRAYLACGFQEDGVLRDDFFRGGRWHDQILMSVLESDYAGEGSNRS